MLKHFVASEVSYFAFASTQDQRRLHHASLGANAPLKILGGNILANLGGKLIK